MKKFTYVLSLVVCLSSQNIIANSLTGSVTSYLDICLKASTDAELFKVFRSLPEYKPILEISQEGECAEYLRAHASPETMSKLDLFRRADAIGNPSTHTFSDLGNFSGTVMRYVIIADQIKKLFQLPDSAHIVEIGAGFGGQCFVLSQLQNFSRYSIYDLPAVDALIKKVVETLGVQNVVFMPLDQGMSESFDLVISNYAFTECDPATKKDYFDKVIKKAKRGYMICNAIVAPIDDLLGWLHENNMNPVIHDEPVFSYTGNKLVTWNN